MTLHPTSVFNVRASLNQWITTQAAGIAKPSWAATFAFVYTMPETGIQPPCVSLFHLDVAQDRAWSGDRVSATERGLRAAALLDISLWVSRADANWIAQLTYMESVMRAIITAESVVVLSNYLAAPSSPTATVYKVNLGSLNEVLTAPDPNPDIMRRRLLLGYNWVYRQAG